MERTKYLESVFDETKGNTNEFFALMKSCSNLRGETPESMIFEGSYVKGDDKIKAFATQLGSCFNQNAPSLGEGFTEVNETLFDIYQTNFQDNRDLWMDFDPEITIENVTRMIGELKFNKDPGPMQIPPNFLQFNVESVAPIIANAINVMLSTGKIPDERKRNYITPIPKKGSSVEIANYRGIAMQSCLPKILDKHLTSILYERLGHTIGPGQHGFMRGRGTTTNLLEITQLLHENIRNGQVDVIYLDYSKAFDHIRHDLSAAKLSKLGMPFSLYRIIMNFITDRKYILKIDGVVTKHEISPKSSVPQGSHMGPISYILYTNGLGLDELCFADDTKLFLRIKNMKDRNELQEKINKIEQWSEENGLTLNPSKTYVVSYGKRKVNSIYFLKGTIIKEVNEVRDLGVLFDNKLTFKSHIDYISKGASQMIGAARRFVTGLNNTSMMTRIYSIYIQPAMEYCAVI